MLRAIDDANVESLENSFDAIILLCESQPSGYKSPRNHEGHQKEKIYLDSVVENIYGIRYCVCLLFRCNRSSGDGSNSSVFFLSHIWFCHLPQSQRRKKKNLKRRAVHFTAANSRNRFNWFGSVKGETP